MNISRKQSVNTAPRRVVVALRMAGIAGQDKLNGVFDFLGADRRWQLIIYRTRHEFTSATVAQEIERGADGFIVGLPNADDALAALAASAAPVVLMNVSGGGIERRSDGVAFVNSDDAAIGREGAATLLRQGIYKSYGYAGYRTDDGWSHARGVAFRDAIAEAGFVGRMLDVDHYHDKVEDHETVAAWIAALPKPCGIFAACDDRAFELVDICREIGVKIPSEVGILGVNNDPILCENANPPLSSIQPDFIGEGRLAAEILERMMAGHLPPSADRARSLGILRVVHRASTVPQSEAGRFVQKVLAYLNREALKGIGVDDVTRKFKTSRSLLELRFRELQHESVYEAMLRIRLEEVKRRLRCTQDTIERITSDCGWSNSAPPKALFKKRFGMTMRDYRASNV